MYPFSNPHNWNQSKLISFSERLTDLGFECETINNLTYQQLLTKAEDYVGFVIRSRFAIDVPMINAAKQLKFIAFYIYFTHKCIFFLYFNVHIQPMCIILNTST